MKPKRSIKATIRYYRENSRQALRGAAWRVRHRLANRALDARARLAGACNASTWVESIGDYAGGYSHWRCGKRRGHLHPITGMDQPHRFNNYIWRSGDKVEYAPIPVHGLDENVQDWDQIIPFRKITDRRHPIETMRRVRVRARRMNQLLADRRTERRVAP